MAVVEKRGVGAGGQQGVDLNSPPYAIHNGKILPYVCNCDVTRKCSDRSSLPQHPGDQRDTLRRNCGARRTQHVWAHGGKDDKPCCSIGPARKASILDQQIYIPLCWKMDWSLGISDPLCARLG
jgi:hypothetical protein